MSRTGDQVNNKTLEIQNEINEKGRDMYEDNKGERQGYLRDMQAARRTWQGRGMHYSSLQ
eukprot:1517080-Amphidinium_carterae.1